MKRCAEDDSGDAAVHAAAAEPKAKRAAAARKVTELRVYDVDCVRHAVRMRRAAVHGSGTATSISKAGFGSLVGALVDNRMREIETENDAQLRYAALISRAAVVDPPPDEPAAAAAAADGGCAAAATAETEAVAAPPEAPIAEVHFSVKPMGGRKKAFVDRVVILRDTDEIAAALGAFAREADCHGTPSINDLASHSPSLLWSLYAMLITDNDGDDPVSSAGNTEERTVLLMQRLLRGTAGTAT